MAQPPRPRLLGTLAVVGPDAVSVGSGDGARVVRGLTAGEVATLRAVADGVPLTKLYAVAAAHDRHGDADARVDRLLALLHRHGILDPVHLRRPDVWSRPLVVVDGVGALTEAVLTAVRASGETRVTSDARRVAAEDISLVLLASDGPADPAFGDLWMTRGVAHAPVRTMGELASIGPLIPAHRRDQPCVRCLWLASLPPAASVAGAPIRAPASTIRAAAALVGLAVGAMAAGTWLPPGISVEVSPPWPRLDYRRWQVHPCCPEHRLPRLTVPSPAPASSSPLRHQSLGAGRCAEPP